MADGAQASRDGGGGSAALTAADVASLVRGEIARGDPARVAARVAPLDRAASDEVSFYANAKYAEAFAATRAGIVLVAPALADADGANGATRVVVDKPHEALLALLPALYRPPTHVPGVHPTAHLGRGVRLGDDVMIGAGVVIGDGATVGSRVRLDANVVLGEDVVIGDDTRVFANATLYAGVRVGARVAIHSGARLGSDGFGYVFGEGRHRKIPHVGRCVVEDDVEIGANTTIDRGSIDDTVIGAGTKIDNLVHVGHNVRIGRLCLVMAQVGISGSAVVEDGAILAGQVGVGGHLTIGRGARIGGQAGVFGDVPAGATYSGYPARPHKESLRAIAASQRIAGMMSRLERLLARSEREDATS